MKRGAQLEERICWGYSRGDSFALIEEESLQEIDGNLEEDKLRVWAKKVRNFKSQSEELLDKKNALMGVVFGDVLSPAVASLSTLISSNEPLSSEQISDKIIEIKFKILSEKWKNESKYISLVKKSFNLESYKEIIKMEEKVIPFLLKELSETNNYWFEALKQITKANPIEPAHYNDFQKMTEDWLNWGRQNHYFLL